MSKAQGKFDFSVHHPFNDTQPYTQNVEFCTQVLHTDFAMGSIWWTTH